MDERDQRDGCNGFDGRLPIQSSRSHGCRIYLLVVSFAKCQKVHAPVGVCDFLLQFRSFADFLQRERGFTGEVGRAVVFDYSKGADIPVSTPELLSRTPLSLWNVALELHVGRCYSPLLGPLSDLFVFISGLLISLVLISGYIILHRRKKKKSKNKE